MSFSTVPSSATIKLTPFKVEVTDDALAELKALLKASKLPPATYESQLPADGPERGTNKFGLTRKWIEEAKARWEEGFDWRAHEAKINEFPQFRATIPDDAGRDYSVHFVALFSEKPDAIPLLLLHGWPGSFLEFIGILRLLKSQYTPATLPYHVIVPSVPGYGFTATPFLDLNFETADAALLLDRLMQGLGFGKKGYVSQGGDIGSVIARYLAAKFDSCKAVHLNFCAMGPPTDAAAAADIADFEMKGLERAGWWTNIGSAYAKAHGTRPATVGFVLTSSPLALLAWIGEKFVDWVDEPLPLDTILECISLYWFTSCISTSVWAYRELASPDRGHGAPGWHVSKPLGYSYTPQEVLPMPKAWVATTGNLVWYKRHTKGGHFLALEQPQAVLTDIEEFVAQVWPDTQLEGAVGSLKLD